MIINSLSIDNFRNFEKLHVDFSPSVNIFYGKNGSGKTNLLEAIFVLCLGRSHKAASETVLVNKESDFYRIEGSLSQDNVSVELAVAYQKTSRKKITLDKVAIKTSELYDNFCAVAAGPEDSEILAGPPSSRRTFIDIYLSQYSKKYLRLLTDYHKVLQQKNAGLKNKVDISSYNEMLVINGSEIILLRKQFLDAIKVETKENYSNIASGSDFNLEYKPSVKNLDSYNSAELIQSAFRETLENYRMKESIMERSLVGPHLDDIAFTIDSMPARNYGSQGEIRTAALSLKLAVYKLIKEKRQITPLLLLDEIFAELDVGRAEGLINLFANFDQLFLTTAVEPPEFLKAKGKSFLIDNGNIIDKA